MYISDQFKEKRRELQPSCIDLLEASDPAAMVQQDVSLLAENFVDVVVEVRREPIEQDHNGLLCTTGVWQSPFEKFDAILCSI